MEIIKESLGEELFKICYEEDEYILGVVGGTLKDFLNSFSTLLKQSSHCQEADLRTHPSYAWIKIPMSYMFTISSPRGSLP